MLKMYCDVLNGGGASHVETVPPDTPVMVLMPYVHIDPPAMWTLGPPLAAVLLYTALVAMRTVPPEPIMSPPPCATWQRGPAERGDAAVSKRVCAHRGGGQRVGGAGEWRT